MRHRVQVCQVSSHARLNYLVPLLVEPLLFSLASQFSECLLAIEVAEIACEIVFYLAFAILIESLFPLPAK